YTALNLLEKSADSLVILDGNGLTRFKNGIVVDGFTGHQVGDVLSYDYNCSMDFEKGRLYPPFGSYNTKFDVWSLDNATNKGDQITLSYSLENFITQDIASSYENINPAKHPLV